MLTNFEQRWTKQCDPSFLVPSSTLANLMPRTSSSTLMERNWKVQVYRSIDHVSVSDLSTKLSVDRSIHEAYVEAIGKFKKIELGISLNIIVRYKCKCKSLREENISFKNRIRKKTKQ